MIDVLCVGHPAFDIYIDVPEAHLHPDNALNRQEVCLLWGEKYHIHRLNTGFGGNSLNVAVGLQQLGFKSFLVASLGVDFFGEYTRKTLEDMNVDLSYVQPSPKTDTSIILNFKGDRTILSYQSDEAYSLPIDIEHEEVSWIFLTSTGFSTFPDLFDSVSAYLEKHPSTKLIFNPGSRELEEHKAATKILQKTDVLIVNLEEACELAQKQELIQNSALKEQDRILALMSYFLDNKVDRVVITNGGSGAYGMEHREVFHQPPFPSNIVEKTGAGDAFTTGILGGMLSGHTLIESLSWGAAESASVMEIMGAAKGLLSKEAVKNSIESNSGLGVRKITSL